FLCNVHNINCVYSDTLVRVTTHARMDLLEVLPYKPLDWPAFNTASVVVHKKDDSVSAAKYHPFFSNQLLGAIGSMRPSEKLVLYVPRKGLAPITVCRDCGTVVTANTVTPLCN